MNISNNDQFLMKPKNDYVFKRIFGNPKNSDLLISLLESILNEKITSVEILNSEIMKENIEAKKSILDIRANIDKGVQVDIEIQLSRTIYMPARSLYYWSKMYGEQLLIGEKYKGLKKTICINIVDFDATKSNTYHSVYNLMERNQGYMLTDIMEIHFVEMTKLKKVYEGDNLSQWIRFIKGESRREIEEMAIANKDIDKALEILMNMSMDKNERAAYLSREMALHDQATFIEEGREEGREKGREEGIKLTRKIFKLHNSGKSVEDIAKECSVSIEEVKSIIED